MKVGGVFNTFYNEKLPFPLTGAQKRVIREIRQDTVLLELASLPGGFCEAAQARPGYLAARGLPGRYAPDAAAAIIRDAIFRTLSLEGSA